MNQLNEKNMETVNLDDEWSVHTPLENILGIPSAEEVYEMLSIREQIILDLLIVGWSQTEIALCFEVTAPVISISVRRMRFKLMNSKLKMILETRQMRRNGEL